MGYSDEWTTPQALFDALNDEFNFTLDPCSTHDNAKCERHFTKAENGLSQDWRGECVFMNPPYGRGIEAWMRKAYEESRNEGTIVVALIPNRSNAPWWHDYVMEADEIRFIRKKVSFGGSSKGVPFWGSVVAVFLSEGNWPIVSTYIQPQHLEEKSS